MLRKRTSVLIAAAALTAGVGAGAGGYAAASNGERTTAAADIAAGTAVSAATSLSVGEIYERTSEGVVEIIATQGADGAETPFPFGEQQAQQAQGSGFVYDAEGHVVTNYHVVQNASSVEVRFSDGSTYDATVVGTDPSTDLAVLKVDAPASELHPLALGDSDEVSVGDGVVAIGSPFGLTETVTSGIVSALDRTISSLSSYSISGAIQTDAAINHGNSGGPLLNLSGDVIGVNSQIESQSGGNDGVGFAIPSNTVRDVADQLIGSGEVEHAYLGVSVQAPADGAGAQIGSVTSGSPAAEAGLEPGDVVTALDGSEIASPDELTSAISAKSPGDAVTLTFTRSGETKTVDVTLGSRPA